MGRFGRDRCGSNGPPQTRVRIAGPRTRATHFHRVSKTSREGLVSKYCVRFRHCCRRPGMACAEIKRGETTRRKRARFVSNEFSAGPRVFVRCWFEKISQLAPARSNLKRERRARPRRVRECPAPCWGSHLGDSQIWNRTADRALSTPRVSISHTRVEYVSISGPFPPPPICASLRDCRPPREGRARAWSDTWRPRAPVPASNGSIDFAFRSHISVFSSLRFGSDRECSEKPPSPRRARLSSRSASPRHSSTTHSVSNFNTRIPQIDSCRWG